MSDQANANTDRGVSTTDQDVSIFDAPIPPDNTYVPQGSDAVTQTEGLFARKSSGLAIQPFAQRVDVAHVDPQ